jgi:hypothetical protein
MVSQVAIPKRTRATKTQPDQADILEAARDLLAIGVSKDNGVTIDSEPFMDVKDAKGAVTKTGQSQAQVRAWYVRVSIGKLFGLEPGRSVPKDQQCETYITSTTWKDGDGYRYAVRLKKEIPNARLPEQIAQTSQQKETLPAKRSGTAAAAKS